MREFGGEKNFEMSMYLRRRPPIYMGWDRPLQIRGFPRVSGPPPDRVDVLGIVWNPHLAVLSKGGPRGSRSCGGIERG